MQVRRPSPAVLAIALVVALLAPVGVVVATGLVHGPLGGGNGGVETADGGGVQDGRRILADGDAPRRVGDGPSMSGTASPPTTAPAATASATTAPPAPTTAPPTTAPPPPTTAPPAPTTAPPAPPPPAPAGAVEQVVALVNDARADAGCGALRVDARITAAAQAHSDDMAANDYFSHDSLDGRTFSDRLRAAGYPSPGGENIAQGQRSAQAVHQAWMNSPLHRANILNCGFTAIGVGLNQSAWTWTQDFGY